MKCANCNCEIGNLTQCPYCGHKNRYVYRAQNAGQYGTVGQYAPTRSAQPSYSGQRRTVSYPTQAARGQTGGYTQSAPTRTTGGWGSSYNQNAPTRTAGGQGSSYAQSAPTRTAGGQGGSYTQSAPTRTAGSQNVSYSQNVPSRAASPDPRSTRRRTSRESSTVEFLLRLILLMQCMLALLQMVELVLRSIGI